MARFESDLKEIARKCYYKIGEWRIEEVQKIFPRLFPLIFAYYKQYFTDEQMLTMRAIEQVFLRRYGILAGRTRTILNNIRVLDTDFINLTMQSSKAKDAKERRIIEDKIGTNLGVSIDAMYQYQESLLNIYKLCDLYDIGKKTQNLKRRITNTLDKSDNLIFLMQNYTFDSDIEEYERNNY